MKRTIILLAPLLILFFSAMQFDTAAAGPLDDGKTLSLDLKGVPLTSVLSSIAQQHSLNMVFSPDLKEQVTLRLDSVDLATALDAILSANGMTYYLKGDVIIIKSAAEGMGAELSSRVITLRYADPTMVAKALTSCLSAGGKVVVLDKVAEGADAQAAKSTYQANRLIITDYPAVIEQALKVISQLDVAERVILIEAKIIETQLDSDRDLGFLWPSTVTTRGGDVAGTTSTETSTTTTSQNDLGAFDLEQKRWTWGKLSIQQMNLVLNLLSRDGNSKLISDPKITTTENQEAEIKIATVIPIQTLNRFSEGAVIQDIVSFQDEEVGISLKVTPRINEEGTLTLEVAPHIEDIIGYTGPIDNQRPITTERSLKTRITVKDGESIALGGLLKENQIERIQRVPLLGHIPILGSLLFTNKSKEKTTTDLIILITPHILK